MNEYEIIIRVNGESGGLSILFNGPLGLTEVHNLTQDYIIQSITINKVEE